MNDFNRIKRVELRPYDDVQKGIERAVSELNAEGYRVVFITTERRSFSRTLWGGLTGKGGVILVVGERIDKIDK